jgi:hypothetical protein
MATVDGVPVRVADARELRALVHPPPTERESRRLALDVAVAQWMRSGSASPYSNKRRLAVYRDVVELLHGPDDSPLSHAERVDRYFALARAAARIEAGPCAEASGSEPRATGELSVKPMRLSVDRDWKVLREKNRTSPLFVLEHYYWPAGGDARAREIEDLLLNLRAGRGSSARLVVGRSALLGVTSLDALELELARELDGAKPDAVLGPLRTPSGIHVLRVRKRLEPGTLPETPRSELLEAVLSFPRSS